MILEKVLDATCRYYKINKYELISGDRHKHLVQARATFAIVATHYESNKAKIARYIDKHESTFHNWLAKDDAEINRAVTEVKAEMDGVVDTINQFKKYFEQKEKVGILQRELKQKEDELHQEKRMLDAMEEDLSVDDLWRTVWAKETNTDQ